ncbi:MAG: hypothetical protein ACM3X9_09430 [Bacillota bacterium]
MKKITACFVAMIMLLAVTITAWAAADGYRGSFLGLSGTKSLVEGSYQLTDNLKLEGDWTDDTKATRADLRYQLGDWFGIKVGARNDGNSNETNAYGGIDFFLPFGVNNLKLAGFYNRDYEGKDWSNYEAALRIEMYKDQFVYAGVRGDGGTGFTAYEYNPKNDPLFFIRGDFNWQWGKFGINLQPLIYATGYILGDVNFKYRINDRTNIVLNATDYYDREHKYRIGLEYKF